jgi:hypothetical protein
VETAILRAALQQNVVILSRGVASINADSMEQSDRHRKFLSVRFFCFPGCEILAQQIRPITGFVFGACCSGRRSELFG